MNFGIILEYLCIQDTAERELHFILGRYRQALQYSYLI